MSSPYTPPAAPLPAWLSYTSSPTLTVDVPFTVATLLPNGVPTLIASSNRVTQYETAIIQLPITVDPEANVSGQNLGELYTTAGGTEPTVVRALGGTRAFTLGVSETRALAASQPAVSSPGGGEASATFPAGTSQAATASTLPTVGTSRQASTPSATSTLRTSTHSLPTSTSRSASSPASTTTSPPSSSSAAPQSASFLLAVQSSLSVALSSVTDASSVNPTSVASLQSALASASSALSATSPLASSSPASSSSISTTSASSASSPSLSSSSLVSLSASSSSDPSAIASPSRSLHSLTPSQLAAAIAAPICFFFALLALILLCCCLARRRRRRKAAAAVEYDDDADEGGAAGAGGGDGGAEEQGLLGSYAGAGAAGGGRALRTPSSRSRVGRLGEKVGGGSRRQKGKITWEWVPPRVASPTPNGAGAGAAEDGRQSRASGRSVLAVLTGGLFGGAGTRPGPPQTSNGEHRGGQMTEKTDEERRLLGTPAKASGREAFFAERSSAGGRYSPVEGTHHEREPAEHGELQDVDLSSPRVDDQFRTFSPLPLHDDEDVFAPAIPKATSVPTLPPISGANTGGLRLSRYYTPSDDLLPVSSSSATITPTSAPLQQTPSLPLPSLDLSPLPGSESSYDSPPLRTPPLLAPPIPFFPSRSNRGVGVEDVAGANRSLGEFRDGYMSDTEYGSFRSSAVGEGGGGGDKRETRLGYLSWNSRSGVLPTLELQQEDEGRLTPPLTPKSPEVDSRVVPTISRDSGAYEEERLGAVGGPSEPSWRRGAPVVSEMGWLSGRWSGLLGGGGGGKGRNGDEEERAGSGGSRDGSGGSRESRRTNASSFLDVRMPSTELFFNTSRWLGGSYSNRRSSPPPLSGFDPAPSLPPISYDSPISFHRQGNDPVTVNSSSSDNSLSRYDDQSPNPVLRTPSLRALPDSPLIHPSPGYPFPRFAASTPTADALSAPLAEVRPTSQAAKRTSIGGASALNRIAASFNSTRSLSADGHNSSSAEDERRDGFGEQQEQVGPKLRGSIVRKARQREISTESATDPLHHVLPTRPRPTAPSTPPRRPTRDVRRSQIRSSQTTPILFLPPHQAPPIPASASVTPLLSPNVPLRYNDPFEQGMEEEEGEVVWDMGAGTKAVPDIRQFQSVLG
ncbi:hypothetical protein JCM8547_007841 [Rhodosporidiobolus lusitaniae]